MNTVAALYGLNLPCSCLINDLSAPDSHQFFIGTCSPINNNEIHHIRYNEDDNTISNLDIFEHKNEVISMISNTKYKDFLLTTYFEKSDNNTKASIYKIEDKEDKNYLNHTIDIPINNNNNLLLFNEDKLVSFNNSNNYLLNIYTLPDIINEVTELSSTKNTINLQKIVNNDNLHIFDFNNIVRSKGAFDIHHKDFFTISLNNNIYNFDIRTLGCTSSIINSHCDTITDIDYNPNKPFYFITSSNDRLIKVWDLRSTNNPLTSLNTANKAVLGGHTHWITNAKYNKFHDQLILSSSTSGEVLLWNLYSCSSAPPIDTVYTDSNSKEELDYLVKSYINDFDDSVYSISWSICDAWIFASLSYDGRCVINAVPSNQKYKILL